MPDTCNIIASPVGALKLIASDRGLRAVLWEHDSPTRVRIGELIARPDHPTLRLAERQLREYFAGQRSAFDLPLDFIATTFQTKGWTALLTIPLGETRTYAQIPAQTGSPNALRAAGAANGRNPPSTLSPSPHVTGHHCNLTGLAVTLHNEPNFSNQKS